jgi:hypothetical protein
VKSEKGRMIGWSVVVVAAFVLATTVAAAAVGKEHVVMIPKDWTYPEEHLGIPLSDFIRGAIKVYNYSDLIMTVPDDWEFLELVTNLKRAGRSKREGANLDDLHIHGNSRKLWIRDYMEDVGDYVNVTAQVNTNSWALDRIDQTLKPLDGKYLGFESGLSDLRVVHFYVVDTGVDTHPDISQTIINEFNAPGGDPTDCNGTRFFVTVVFTFTYHDRSRNPCNGNCHEHHLRSIPRHHAHHPLCQGSRLQWYRRHRRCAGWPLLD